jgi:hypothetical protein
MDDKNRTGCDGSRRPEDDPASGPTPVLLDFLIARHPALYSIDELVRLFSSPGQDQAQERFELEEGIKALVGDGLAHRLDQFVFASHAAVSGGWRMLA